jgi:hypothetical protein
MRVGFSAGQEGRRSWSDLQKAAPTPPAEKAAAQAMVHIVLIYKYFCDRGEPLFRPAGVALHSKV